MVSEFLRFSRFLHACSRLSVPLRLTKLAHFAVVFAYRFDFT